MRILVTNDDGVHAPGLAMAERIANTLSDDVYYPKLEKLLRELSEVYSGS